MAKMNFAKHSPLTLFHLNENTLICHERTVLKITRTQAKYYFLDFDINTKEFQEKKGFEDTEKSKRKLSRFPGLTWKEMSE